jgi:hypothetical protein
LFFQYQLRAKISSSNTPKNRHSNDSCWGYLQNVGGGLLACGVGMINTPCLAAPYRLDNKTEALVAQKQGTKFILPPHHFILLCLLYFQVILVLR